MSQDDPEYENCKINFNTCQSMLRRDKFRSKIAYYLNKFNTHKTNIKLTWNTISEVLHRKGVNPELFLRLMAN